MTSRTSLWLMRFYYLLWTGAGGFIFPIISLFYAERGFSGTQIGWLGTIGSLVALVSAPLLGRISNRVHNPRRILQLCLFGSGALILLLSQQHLFGWMALIVAVESVLGAPIYPLSDAQAMNISNEKEGFGSIRIWGSLGWAATAFAGGWMVSRTGLVSVFYGYALLYGICLIVIGHIIRPPKLTQKFEEPHSPFRMVLHSFVSHKALLGLTIALTILWPTNNRRHQFETLYMHEFGANEQLIGWAYTYPTLMELSLMWRADKLICKYGAGKLLSPSLVLEGSAISAVAIYTSLAPILSLYYVKLAGVISLVTASLSGMIFDNLGAYPLYIIATIGTFAGWLALVISQKKPAPLQAQVI